MRTFYKLMDLCRGDAYQCLDFLAEKGIAVVTEQHVLKELEKLQKIKGMFLFYEDDRIRANAVEAIELLGRKEDILEMLPPLINDKSNRVRANVLKAIGKFRIEEILRRRRHTRCLPCASRSAGDRSA